MSLQIDHVSRRLFRGLVTIFCAAGLSACGVIGGGSHDSGLASVSSADVPGAQPGNGPQADYPVVVGDPYRVGGTEYVPTDTMNYDHVGYTTVDGGTQGYSAANHTLPLPSYVEVTSLETGRTILVRVERRGPMTSNHLIALSPAANAQLGATGEHPVRVRRVNPPEEQRALLRSDNAAPLRMDTPASLLSVLQRRLPASGAASLHASAPASSAQNRTGGIETVEIAASNAAESPAPVATPVAVPPEAAPQLRRGAAVPALPPLEPLGQVGATDRREDSFASAFRPTAPSAPELAPVPTPSRYAPLAQAPAAPPAVTPSAAVEAAANRFVVQAAAFSTMERARRVANVIGGEVSQAGRLYRVRTGPFATRGEAEASLANVRRAGYSDARILTSG